MSQYPASIKYTAEKGWILPPVEEAAPAPKTKTAPKRKPRAKSKPKE